MFQCLWRFTTWFVRVRSLLRRILMAVPLLLDWRCASVGIQMNEMREMSWSIPNKEGFSDSDGADLQMDHSWTANAISSRISELASWQSRYHYRPDKCICTSPTPGLTHTVIFCGNKTCLYILLSCKVLLVLYLTSIKKAALREHGVILCSIYKGRHIFACNARTIVGQFPGYHMAWSRMVSHPKICYSYLVNYHKRWRTLERLQSLLLGVIFGHCWNASFDEQGL